MITAFSDRSFTFRHQDPPASYFLKRPKIERARRPPASVFVGKGHDGAVPRDRQAKMADLNAHDIDGGGEMIKVQPVRWACKWWRVLIS